MTVIRHCTYCGRKRASVCSQTCRIDNPQPTDPYAPKEEHK